MPEYMAGVPVKRFSAELQREWCRLANASVYEVTSYVYVFIRSHVPSLTYSKFQKETSKNRPLSQICVFVL